MSLNFLCREVFHVGECMCVHGDLMRGHDDCSLQLYQPCPYFVCTYLEITFFRFRFGTPRYFASFFLSSTIEHKDTLVK